MLKKFLLGTIAGLMGIATIAVAQTTLPPFITGTSTEHRNEVFDVGFLRLAQRNTALVATPTGTQANGVALNMGFNRVATVATATDAATLPTLSGSVMVVVVNSGANSMNIFPPLGGTINGGSVNAAYALAAGKTVIFFQGTDLNYYGNLSA